ncbi:hypothetical protein [Rhodococcus sp. ARC_M6]|uniref:hypothetical protein n=1 Tax=Rhodococcus sp. ARC_M6 TaxID=2928852 RepID=UPI001FB52202|nr:hypothetical protein [Rhodococcus sp. ARC_M6]MCJ0907064.1 hypothetical protein [Rhodococcus sp. ARC_M6]
MSQNRHTPPELTDLEQARLQAMQAIGDSASSAARRRDIEGVAVSVIRMSQIDLDGDRARNSLHLPTDAGEHTEALKEILLRIPDGWGRWIGHRKGWYPLVVGLDAALAEIDPDYDVCQVKEKFGVLRYYYNPHIDNKELCQQMRTLVDAAESESEATCEECGATSSDVQLRTGRYIVETLCDACEDAHPGHTTASDDS